MRKIIAFSLFLLLFSKFSFAQITVSTNSLWRVNDTLRYWVDTAATNISISPAGANQTWDFSGLRKHDFIEEPIQPASAGPAASQFPTADILVSLGFGGQQGGAIAYTESNPNDLKVVGLSLSAGGGGGMGIPTDFAITPAFEYKKAPFTYLNNYTTNGGFRFTIDLASVPFLDSLINANIPIPGASADSLRVTTGLKRTVDADAWGTCITPDISTSVLRLKIIDEQDIKLEIHLVTAFGKFWFDATSLIPAGTIPVGQDTITTYQYVDANSKEPIVQHTTTSRTGNILRRVDFKKGGTVGLISEYEADPITRLYPNPASKIINIEFANLSPDKYTVRIHNIVGKLVAEKTLQLHENRSIQMDISNLPKGNYLYSLLDNKNRVMGTKKFVVQ